MSADPGTSALEALGRALAAKPRRDGEAFEQATEQLCRLREAMIRRPGRDDAALGKLNAVISTVLAGHFPLGEPPWPEVEAAERDLRTLVARG